MEKNQKIYCQVRQFTVEGVSDVRQEDHLLASLTVTEPLRWWLAVWKRKNKENKMKKLLITVMGLAIAGVASADNMVVNGSFEQTFSDGVNTVDSAIDGSFAYGSNGGGANNIPSWGGDQNWGFAKNPDGLANHFGFTSGMTAASDGNIVYGAGHTAHYFGIWQNVTANGSGTADGTLDYTLSFDAYQSSTIAGGAWLVATIQMLDGVGGYMEASMGAIGTPSGLPADSWQPVELTFSADAGFDGSQIQIFLQGAGGTYVDNVDLVAVPEPATLGLFGLLGGGMLWIRKRFTI